MPLSAKKQAKAARADRVKKINEMSLDGKGYFMDAGHHTDARSFINTGDEKFLRHIPDYRKIRTARVRP